MLAVILLIVLVVYATAKCDNACSGHGRCGQNGVCTCYDNWGLGLGHLSGDCSQRVCPYEFAWVDSPNKQGRFHKYAECSNRGICNRDTGDCECFPGYEGKACARTTCPNDCSGHGQCKDINSLPYTSSGLASTDWRYGYFLPNLNSETSGDAYKQWDSMKTRGCVCDPEYGDVDCSKRMCMYGTDVMDQRQDLKVPGKYQVQHIHLQVENVNGVYNKDNLYKKTFALVFKSKLNETFTTQPIVLDPTAQGLHDFSLDVTKALTSLPNQVIDHVKVQAIINTATSQNAFAFFDQTAGPGVTINCNMFPSTGFPKVSFNPSAQASSGATTIAFASTSGVTVGMLVTATNVPSGTTVTGLTGTQVTLSAATTGAIATTASVVFGVVTVALSPSSNVGSSATTMTFASTSGVTVGMLVTATNVPSGTTVTGLTGTQVTLSAATTGAIATTASVVFGVGTIRTEGTATASGASVFHFSSSSLRGVTVGMVATSTAAYFPTGTVTVLGFPSSTSVTLSSAATGSVGIGSFITFSVLNSFSSCSQYLYGVKYGTKVTASTSSGTPIAFGASFATSTTVSSLSGPTAGSLALAPQYTGSAYVTFSGFQTSTVTVSCTGTTRCTNTAGNYVGYGAVVSPATGSQAAITVTALASLGVSTSASVTSTSALPPMSNLNSLGLGGAVQVGSDLLPSHNYIYMNITFDGNNVQGPQHPIMVKDILCGDGCTPKLTGLNLLARTQNVTEIQKSDFNSYECGRRGKCDYTTGQCTCFSGYTGLSCNVITSLV